MDLQVQANKDAIEIMQLELGAARQQTKRLRKRFVALGNINLEGNWLTGGKYNRGIFINGLGGVGVGTNNIAAAFNLRMVDNATWTWHEMNCYSTTAGFFNIIRGVKSNSNTLDTLVTTTDGHILLEVQGQGVDNINVARAGAYIRYIQNGAAAGRVPTDIRIGTSTNAAENANLFVASATNNIGIRTVTFQAASVGYLAIANGTEPAAATADQIYIGSKDSAGTGATIALRTENTIATEAVASDSTARVWWNGVEYKILLRAV